MDANEQQAQLDPARSILEQAFPPILGASDQPVKPARAEKRLPSLPIVDDRYSGRPTVVNLPPFEDAIYIVYRQDWTPVGLCIDHQWFHLVRRPTGIRISEGKFCFPLAERSERAIVQATWRTVRQHARSRGLKLPPDDQHADTATIARWTADLLVELDREWDERVADAAEARVDARRARRATTGRPRR